MAIKTVDELCEAFHCDAIHVPGPPLDELRRRGTTIYGLDRLLEGHALVFPHDQWIVGRVKNNVNAWIKRKRDVEFYHAAVRGARVEKPFDAQLFDLVDSVGVVCVTLPGRQRVRTAKGWTPPKTVPWPDFSTWQK